MTDRIKITKEMLEKLISDNSPELPLEEIEALMDSEVEKLQDEMDTELVDMCAAILAKAYNPGYKDEKPAQMYRPWENESPESKPEAVNTENPRKKVIPFKRVLAVAAAVIVIAVVSLSAGATLLSKSDSKGVIGFYEDFFRINVNGEETTASEAENDLVNQMILDSLNSKPLPQALLNDEYEKSVGKIVQDEDKSVIFITVRNTQNDISGHISISQYKSVDHSMVNGFGNVSDKHRNFKQLTIDGKDIFVFEMEGKSYINYTDGNTNYEIALICDFDTMVSIAETISVEG